MNKLIAIMAVMLLASVATGLACHLKVHVQDDTGANMYHVPVTVTSTCGWGIGPSLTHSDGWTDNWQVLNSCTYTATATYPEYLCSTGSNTTNNDQRTIHLTCEPKENDVPEFGTIAASLAMAGAGAGYLLLRRKK